MDGLPSWGSLSKDDIISFVGKAILLRNGGDHLFRPLEFGAPNIIVRGELQMGVDNFTFLGIKVLQVSPVVICGIDDGTKVWPCPPCQVQDMYNITELCAGMGIFSTFSTLLGFRVIAGVDENEKWRDLFLKGHQQNAVFIHGDCGDRSVVDQLFKAGAMHSMVLSGISCQPHSTGGDMLGMQDSRSDSLPKSLSTAWLVQSPIILLECVPGVLHNKQFQQVLSDFCTSAGYCITQTVLHLSNAWCARRDRWFACLTAKVLGPIQVPDLPILSQYATVGSVLPEIPRWPQHVMDQLVLSLYELMKFVQYGQGGITSCYLKVSEVLPTTLHSAGNQLYPCRCGCRAALTIQRLEKRGLYGVLIPLGTFVTHEHQQWEECRYPHPQELLFLNGGLPSFDFAPDLRLGMAGVGQCVSPIQSIWVASHVAAHLARFLQQGFIEPRIVLLDYIDAVFQARDAVWQFPAQRDPPEIETPEASSPDASVPFCVPDCEGVNVHFRASPHVTVGEFRVAEEKLHGITWPIETIAHEWNVNVSDQVVIESIPFPLTSLIHSHEIHDHEELPGFPSFAEVVDMKDDEIPPTVPYVVQEDANGSSSTGLLNLNEDDYLKLFTPAISSVEAVDALSLQKISQEDRVGILHRQKGVWANDEINFFLHQTCQVGRMNQALMWWDPICLTTVVNAGDFSLLMELAASVPPMTTIVTAVVVEKHWHPLVWRFDGSGVSAFTCGLVHAYSLAHQALHRAVLNSRRSIIVHCLS